MSGATTEAGMKCMMAAYKVIEMTSYGRVIIEPLECDPEGTKTLEGETPRHTLSFDVPVQFGVMARQSCRIDETDADEFVRKIDQELMRIMRAVALMRVILNPNPQVNWKRKKAVLREREVTMEWPNGNKRNINERVNSKQIGQVYLGGTLGKLPQPKSFTEEILNCLADIVAKKVKVWPG
jgi:hypothetical protein